MHAKGLEIAEELAEVKARLEVQQGTNHPSLGQLWQRQQELMDALKHAAVAIQVEQQMLILSKLSRVADLEHSVDRQWMVCLPLPRNQPMTRELLLHQRPAWLNFQGMPDNRRAAGAER